MKQYLVIGIDTDVAWPKSDVTVKYGVYDLLLRPGSIDLAPSIVLAYEPPTEINDALLVVRRFMSSLSWADGHSIRETLVISGNVPLRVGREQQVNLTCSRFQADYLPEPSDYRATLALAFYREALSLNSITYQFLGFFKILNIVCDTAKMHRDWINSTLPKLQSPDACSRLSELKMIHADVGDYLYKSGRCAVAHAYAQPLVDPEIPDDTNRLKADLPLIRALAEYLIEYTLGVKSQFTIWHEHLYELEGFRNIFGNMLVQRIREGVLIGIEECPELPALSIRVRGKSNRPTFENMRARVTEIKNGKVLITCDSLQSIPQIQIVLDFISECLNHDMLSACQCENLSSTKVQHFVDSLMITQDLILNGQLEVWDAKEGRLLGRCDPYVPCNIDTEATLANIEAAITQAQASLKLCNNQ